MHSYKIFFLKLKTFALSPSIVSTDWTVTKSCSPHPPPQCALQMIRPSQAPAIMQSLSCLNQRSANYGPQAKIWTVACFFFIARELRISITFLNSGEKIKRRLFHDVKNTCNADFSVHTSSFIENSYAHLLTMAAFMLQQQSWMVATDCTACKTQNMYSLALY